MDIEGSITWNVFEIKFPEFGILLAQRLKCEHRNSIVRCISADQRFVSTVPGNFPGLRSIDIDLAGALGERGLAGNAQIHTLRYLDFDET